MGYLLAKKRRFGAWAFLALLLAFLVWLVGFKRPDSQFSSDGGPASGWKSAEDGKRIRVIINGLEYGTSQTRSATVADFLAEQKIILGEKEIVLPAKEERLYSGNIITINRTRKIFFSDKDKNSEGVVLGLTVREALEENGIAFSEDDLFSPGLADVAHDGEKIKITRVEIREEKETKNIDFKKIIKEDDKLSWREKKVSQAGKLGKKELTFRAVYHNGKLISRKLAKEEVVEEPVEEISVQGTYVKLGKAHTGLGTWYAWKGGLFAANPWLPMGSYVKVTNLDNGKSVIVRINDRGPFGPNRIIDLDKVAFAKIASLGAGVINVKMEEIKN